MDTIQIVDLMREAAAAGDTEQVRLCSAALIGDVAARARCAAALRAARGADSAGVLYTDQQRANDIADRLLAHAPNSAYGEARQELEELTTTMLDLGLRGVTPSQQHRSALAAAGFCFVWQLPDEDEDASGGWGGWDGYVDTDRERFCAD